MSFKILFLEEESFYNDMLNKKFFLDCELFFNGCKFYRKTEKLKEYDLIVYTIYSSPIYNYVITKALELDINTLLLMDGICEFSNFTNNNKISSLGIENYHPIIANNIGVIGNTAKKYFNEFNINSVHYLPPRVIDTSMNDKIPLSKENIFLITTANTAYYNEYEYNRLVCLLKDIVHSLKKDNINFYFRIFDEKIITDLSISPERNLNTGSFPEILKKINFVITTPSSIMLTAMYHNRPVAMLLYRDSPNFIQSGWLISKDIDYSSTFSSMISFDEKRINFQLSQLENNLKQNNNVQDCFTNIKKSNFKQIAEFINVMNLNMLNSKFNFNIEYIIRNIYRKFIRGSSLEKKLKKK